MLPVASGTAGNECGRRRETCEMRKPDVVHSDLSNDTRTASRHGVMTGTQSRAPSALAGNTVSERPATAGSGDLHTSVSSGSAEGGSNRQQASRRLYLEVA